MDATAGLRPGSGEGANGAGGVAGVAGVKLPKGAVGEGAAKPKGDWAGDTKLALVLGGANGAAVGGAPMALITLGGPALGGGATVGAGLAILDWNMLLGPAMLGCGEPPPKALKGGRMPLLVTGVIAS